MGRVNNRTRAKICIKNEQKALRIGIFVKALIRRCCLAVLEVEGFQKDVEVSVLFVENEQIKFLNNKYRNKNEVTDVLSFPLYDGENYEVGENGVVYLGDVVISTEKVIAQAREFNHSVKREIAFLFVHSMLHLMGYDHEFSEADAKLMRNKEKVIMKTLNIFKN